MLKDPSKQKPVKASDDVTTVAVPANKQDVEITLANVTHDGASIPWKEEPIPWRDVTADIFGQNITYVSLPKYSTDNPWQDHQHGLIVDVIDEFIMYHECHFTQSDHDAMSLCRSLANTSKCTRSKMAASITIDKGLFITGVNGTLPKMSNDCEEMSLVCTVCNVVVSETDYVEGEKHCKHGVIEKRPKTKSCTLHAETNAILRAAKLGIPIKGETMHMTTSPCANCANNIAMSGISKIIFEDLHDDLTGLKILKQANVTVVRYNKEHSC